MKKNRLSLLYPKGEEGFKNLSNTAFHDLGIDFICEKISDIYEEREAFGRIFSKLSCDSFVTEYRAQVFEDVMNFPEMCSKLMEVLEHINYEKQYSGFSGHYEVSDSAWELLHRLEEINDYIKSVEAIHNCLEGIDLKSEGLKNLREYIDSLYFDGGFEDLKKDIQQLKATTNDVKSVTVGINLNEKFEAHGLGLISFNKKPFTKSNVIGEFVSKLSSKDQINPDTDWDQSLKFHPVGENQGIFEKLATIAGANEPKVVNSTLYLDKIANSMLGSIVFKLKSVLKNYVYLPVTNITELIPEFVFYIKFAEYVKKMQAKGFKFARPVIAASKPQCYMDAKGIYNFKLLSALDEGLGAQALVPNDISFSPEQVAYILTGANRGGKTTITQAVGLLFVLAQAGLYIPGEYFEFNPVDSIFTHFPADEDKTMDLGRLGEECKRFKELYEACTSSSLLLLNESFSTTSFEEGYYIARDAVLAILNRGVRTIFNTHMHKLGYDVPEMNEKSSEFKAASLIVKAENGERSFKVQIAPPEGISFAKDIAEKYGVTYEMLTGQK